MRVLIRIILPLLLLLPGTAKTLHAQNTLGEVSSSNLAPSTLLNPDSSHLNLALALYDAALFEGLLANGCYSPHIAAPFDTLPENYLKSLSQVLVHLPLQERSPSDLLCPLPRVLSTTEPLPAQTKRPNSFSAFNAALDFTPLIQDEVASEHFFAAADELRDAVSIFQNAQLTTAIAAKTTITELSSKSPKAWTAEETDAFVFYSVIWTSASLLLLTSLAAYRKFARKKSVKSSRRRHWNRAPSSSSIEPSIPPALPPVQAPTSSAVDHTRKRATAYRRTPSSQEQKQASIPSPAPSSTPSSLTKESPGVPAAAAKHTSAPLSHHHHSHDRKRSGLSRLRRKLLRFLGLKSKKRHSRRRRRHS